MASLRQYQSDDIDKLRHVLSDGAKRVLFEASVGYGKSVVIEYLAAAYSAAGLIVWVLSNRSAVVNQLRKRAGDMPGVTVMTVQAADRRRERLAADPAALILVDEVHMGGAAAQYRRVLDCAPNAIAIGFSGTPKSETFEVFQAHVRGRDAAWLTENGYLAPLRYYCPETVDFSAVRMRGHDYDLDALQAAVERSEICGDAIRSYREHCVGDPTLGFCISVKHAFAVAKEFSNSGFPAEVLTGQDSDEDVDRKIAHLAAG
ncbi:DEAD/DEAH box helicase, partial [Thioclava sediminum]